MENNCNCTICLEPISESNKYCLPACNHTFHTGCILNWFRSGHRSCPLCRDLRFPNVSFMDAEHRAKYYRNAARKNNAPKALKKAVRKLINTENRKKCLYKEKRKFEKENAEIIKTYRKFNKRYYDLLDKIDDQTHLLGIRNYFATPQFYANDAIPDNRRTS
jgi:hypothetical protein